MLKTFEKSELMKISRIAEEFYSSSMHLSGFNIDIFIRTWSDFFDLGVGVIFGLFNEKGDVYGALGGVRYRDPNSGDLIASEFFWYVLKENRGEGLRLLDAFEHWAKRHGCKYINMVYLSDLLPEMIKGIYIKRGYREIEVVYRKEVT